MHIYLDKKENDNNRTLEVQPPLRALAARTKLKGSYDQSKFSSFLKNLQGATVLF